LKALADDLLAEDEALAALCAGLSAAQWQQPTAFKAWTPWDVVAHLCLLDGAALATTHGAAAFAPVAAGLRARRAAGASLCAIARADLGHLHGPALLVEWRAVFSALCTALATLDARDRLPWFGPGMSARSFATARLMEAWAHGQAVWDLLQRVRPATERLQHIAHLGVNTCGWSFSNRGLAAPQPLPHVALRAPDGSAWSWNSPSDSDFVRGPAEDFCLVVAQCRHVDDTGLLHRGSGTAWMHIAQCFAGPPVDGPAPGERRTPA
jgi:uncharacterized protein (TIGR03084 family)